MEIVLDHKLVERRIWPSIDINRSGTRREEMLMDPEEYRRVCVLRRVLHDMNPPDASPGHAMFVTASPRCAASCSG